MEPVSMKDLLEAGVHFGHQTRRWNPKMRRYIYTARNGIHILDLAQTVGLLERAAAFAQEAAAGGGKVLFVGTKKQAQGVIQSEAERAGMPYIITRWLGGTLTNWQTILLRINHMKTLERRDAAGDFDVLPKREALQLREEIRRLQRYFGGLRDLTGLPQALFVVDVPKETLAIKEANRLGIPIIALCDTNADPTQVEYPIPSNDDAIRAIRLVTSTIATAILGGRMADESARADVAAAAAAP